MARARWWWRQFDFQPVPPGPLPQYCRRCTQPLQDKVLIMLPADPLTGAGRAWRTLKCPWHDRAAEYQRGWVPDIHDAWLVERVPERDPLSKPQVEQLRARHAAQRKLDDARRNQIILAIFVSVGLLQGVRVILGL